MECWICYKYELEIIIWSLFIFVENNTCIQGSDNVTFCWFSLYRSHSDRVDSPQPRTTKVSLSTETTWCLKWTGPAIRPLNCYLHYLISSSSLGDSNCGLGVWPAGPGSLMAVHFVWTTGPHLLELQFSSNQSLYNRGMVWFCVGHPSLLKSCHNVIHWQTMNFFFILQRYCFPVESMLDDRKNQCLIDALQCDQNSLVKVIILCIGMLN